MSNNCWQALVKRVTVLIKFLIRRVFKYAAFKSTNEIMRDCKYYGCLLVSFVVFILMVPVVFIDI